MDSPDPAALDRWFRDELGHLEPRRAVRVTASRIVVTRFEDGFAERLAANLDACPALFDADRIAAACGERCTTVPGVSRVETWHATMLGLLESECVDLSAGERSEIIAGLDSVAAVLSAVLWSAPTSGGEYAPLPGEVAAYREATTRFEGASDLFTRCYGTFEGREVVAHCPGVAYARRWLELAWQACTGTAPPRPTP